jgi:peptide/nickel transport system permease protein
MRKYLLKRILQIAITLWVFLTIVFLILQAQPGSIANVYISNPRIPKESKEALQKQLGLNEPLPIQYANYLRNFFTGNLGTSFAEYPRPVWDIIKERLPRTVVLFLTAALLSYLVGYQLGKFIAWKRKGIIDYTSTIGGVLLFTVYTPWLALLLIWIFAVTLGWFPIGKFIDPIIWRQYSIEPNTVFGYVGFVGGGAFLLLSGSYLAVRQLRLPQMVRVGLNGLSVATIAVVVGIMAQSTIGKLALDIAHHMFLPVLTLFCITFAGAMLIMRDTMLDVVREDYVFAAKAKGLPDKVVRNKHAARNALLPIVTAFVLAIAFTVDGGIITETIFSWPGMGLTLLNSTLSKDIPLAVGTFVFVGFFSLIAHLVADILYAVLDPRIRYS